MLPTGPTVLVTVTVDFPMVVLAVLVRTLTCKQEHRLEIEALGWPLNAGGVVYGALVCVRFSRSLSPLPPAPPAIEPGKKPAEEAQPIAALEYDVTVDVTSGVLFE